MHWATADSEASRVKLWGGGKEQLAFQGVCDVIAIDNELLQLQVRTRPGRRAPQWSGVVVLALLWKPTNTILFRFEGNNRFTVNNLDSHRDIVQHTFEVNDAIPGKRMHKFQFTSVSDDNFIRVEELPYGLHNIEVKGVGGTFGGSKGLIGSRDRWSQSPPFQLRDGSNYLAYDASKVAKS